MVISDVFVIYLKCQSMSHHITFQIINKNLYIVGMTKMKNRKYPIVGTYLVFH
jgi:hypothetical protein